MIKTAKNPISPAVPNGARHYLGEVGDYPD